MSSLFSLGDLLIDGVNSFFENIIIGLVGLISDQLTTTFSAPVTTLSDSMISRGVEYAQTLAFSLLVVKTIAEGLNQYMLHESGDSNADPIGLLVRTAQAVVVITFLPDLVTYIFNLGTKVLADVSSIGSAAGDTLKFDGSDLIASISDGATILLLLALTGVIMMFVVTLQSLIRGAEIGLVTVIGPIMALNLTANNKQIWSQWFRHVLVLCISQALQLFLLMVSLRYIASANLPLFLAWIWVTLKSPKIIKELTYSSGLGSAAAGVGRSAGSMALMRVMMKG